MSARSANRRARAILRERLALLAQIEASMELPMLVLGFAWLALLVVELLRGLSPLLEALGTAIWVVFIVHFLIEFSTPSRPTRPPKGDSTTTAPHCGGRRPC
ncbi:hypothetical protein [Piscinibacter sp.]|uniref:hypothetical protein n=1 Tax=Piscinibacter sp. TaxID=1903157 RepID=UPI002CD9F346|nr:hypothetical protein [Albitalea sp.]HUG21710.1 hypothetical protein [Albitalea sp.]